MTVKNSTLLNFIQQGIDVAKAIPEYFSKFSNKIFSNHQHLVLVVLKQKLRTTWRGLTELLEISIVPQVLKLVRIPHFTTLIRFSKKVSPILVNELITYSASLSKPKVLKLAVDATGLELDKASKYYAVIRGEQTKKKEIIQITACGLIDNLMISSVRIARYTGVRNCDFLPVLEESTQLAKVEFVAADKGYDANKNHEYVEKTLKAKSCIKIKVGKYLKPTGLLRKRILKNFDDKTYHQRSKIETIFSMIKRKYGAAIKAKSEINQVQEGYHKVIAHNLDRLCKITLKVIIEGFIRALSLEIFLNKTIIIPFVNSK